MAIKRLGILVGGGPAPGTNGVISAVAIEAIRVGIVPIGFTDGFDWLAQRYTDEQHELTIAPLPPPTRNRTALWPRSRQYSASNGIGSAQRSS